MYRSQTSGGDEIRRELATPARFHRRLAPESEIDMDLSESGTPTDVQTIEKGSEMSVPVDPWVEASDTAGPASEVSTSLAGSRSVQRFSEVPLPRREWFLSYADLLAMGIQPPIMTPPKPPTTYVVRRQQWIKIGKTERRLEDRLKVLRSPRPGVRCPAGMDLGAPLDVLHTITGDIEEDLHARYAEYRVAGEWFLADPVMLAELAELAERRAA